METFRNPFFIVDVDPVRRVVRLTRTKEPIGDVAEIERVFREVGGALKDIPRAEYGLLLDIRDGKLRNDEEFETAIRKNSATMTGGWRKQATLVKTAVGALQINRQARERGDEASVFRDEVEALRFIETI